MKKYFLLALVAASLAGPSHAALIDSFDVEQNVFTSSGEPRFTEVNDPNVIGDYRDLEVSPSDPLFDIVIGSVNGSSPGAFFFEANRAGSAGITWDGNDSSKSVDTDGLGGIDLTDAGASDEFVFDVLSIFGGVDYALTVWDGEGVADSVNGAVPSSGEERIAFSDFSSSFSSSADLTDLGAIRLAFFGDDVANLTIDNVRTESATVIPLPAAFPMMLAGIGALGFISRMRKRS